MKLLVLDDHDYNNYREWLEFPVVISQSELKRIAIYNGLSVDELERYLNEYMTAQNYDYGGSPDYAVDVIEDEGAWAVTEALNYFGLEPLIEDEDELD